MPDRVVWALLAVAVFAQVNRGEKSTRNYYLSLSHSARSSFVFVTVRLNIGVQC